MKNEKQEIKLFNDYKVRHVWDEKAEKYWLSVVDVCTVLTDSDYQTARKYWKVLKGRIISEGSELVTACYQLKMIAPDNKMRMTDVMDTEQVLRLIQSIPSKKAEPFKLWLAKVGSERIDETIDPELSIDRAIQNYRRLGYNENWINQRIKSIEVRKVLTDEWDKSGVQIGAEYASLTDIMTKTWSGMSTREYKNHKGLKKENLRDNMTNTELVLNMLAEVAATEISMTEQPLGYDENASVAKRGANTARVARMQLEKETGTPAVSRLNSKSLKQTQLTDGNNINEE